MTWTRTTASVFVSVAVLAGCAANPALGPSEGEASEGVEASAASSAAPATLGREEVELEAGTYRFDLTALSGGEEFPTFDATIPAGWTSSGGWALGRPGVDGESLPVAVTFWNVDQVYGHPCQWEGTLVQPGPTVEDLVVALVDVPMRNPTRPIEVELGGQAGMYLEWSVPSDIAFDEPETFPDCDEDGQGNFDFRSWTGKGWASTRYHQGPGQIDRLWILDVDGTRLVIDAFVMADAPERAVEELMTILESIRFLDDGPG